MCMLSPECLTALLVDTGKILSLVLAEFVSVIIDIVT